MIQNFFLLKPDTWTDSSDNPNGYSLTQHEQRRWLELTQILKTHSAHTLRKERATSNTIALPLS
jgi:hypothetical protein